MKRRLIRTAGPVLSANEIRQSPLARRKVHNRDLGSLGDTSGCTRQNCSQGADAPLGWLPDNSWLSTSGPISGASLIQQRLESKHDGALQEHRVEMNDYTRQQHP